MSYFKAVLSTLNQEEKVEALTEMVELLYEGAYEYTRDRVDAYLGVCANMNTPRSKNETE